MIKVCDTFGGDQSIISQSIFHNKRLVILSLHYFLHLNVQETIESWLEKADYDSDGRISLEEFKMGIAGNKLVGEFDIDVY